MRRIGIAFCAMAFGIFGFGVERPLRAPLVRMRRLPRYSSTDRVRPPPNRRQRDLTGLTSAWVEESPVLQLGDRGDRRRGVATTDERVAPCSRTRQSVSPHDRRRIRLAHRRRDTFLPEHPGNRRERRRRAGQPGRVLERLGAGRDEPGSAADRPILNPGMEGPEIAVWQTDLNGWLATMTPAVAVDGVFGPSTAAENRALQEAEGITVDGLVGPETRAAFLSDPTVTPEWWTGRCWVQTSWPRRGLADACRRCLRETRQAGGGGHAPFGRARPPFAVVGAAQRLVVRNDTDAPVSVTLAGYTTIIAPGASQEIGDRFGNYLAPVCTSWKRPCTAETAAPSYGSKRDAPQVLWRTLSP